MRDWQLQLVPGKANTYAAELPGTDFGIKLQFAETQAVLLQGKQGLSRKGPEEKQASYYYSSRNLPREAPCSCRAKPSRSPERPG